MSTRVVTIGIANPPLLMPQVRPRDADTAQREIDPLVAAARAGDRDAFEQLVRLHQRVVIRTAMAALGRQEDAEDAAQEAFVLAWRNLPRFRGESSFRTWLLAIAWRRALDKRRRRGRWFGGPSSSPAWTMELVDRVEDPHADPERHAVARDMARRVAGAIARLSPTLRDTLLLAAGGEHSYEEIGRILGAPAGTIKWRVSEARRLVSAAVALPGSQSLDRSGRRAFRQ